MTELNLPTYNHQVKVDNGVEKIFDIVRSQYVVRTPEEWVRQHVIHYMIEHLEYPRGRMAVEKAIKVDRLSRRPDVVVYDDHGKPLMIVELKASSVKISQDTLLQTAMYNKKLDVPYLFLSNGMEHFVAKMNLEENKLDFLDKMPSYKELLK